MRVCVFRKVLFLLIQRTNYFEKELIFHFQTGNTQPYSVLSAVILNEKALA